MRRELEEERAAKTAIKDKLTNTETQLRQTRLRVSKMDKQLREAEASIASLTGTVKSLEDQVLFFNPCKKKIRKDTCTNINKQHF